MIAFAGENVHFWVWCMNQGLSNFASETIDMTQEEKKNIEDCPILIVGYRPLAELISDELNAIGFCQVGQSESFIGVDIAGYNIVIAVDDNYHTAVDVPTLYPFDFIDGGAVIVMLPGDNMEITDETDVRTWVAKYIIGYSAFWNMMDCEWLRELLPRIVGGDSSEPTQRTVAFMCARISASIAVGRNVKHFPRFYLSRNLE